MEEIANHYLGFNGWSSQVLYHRQEESEQMNSVKYCSAIKLTFVDAGNGPREVEGAGMAEIPFEANTPADRARAIQQARKQSIAKAKQNAFSKVLICSLDNGEKVSVEIDTTKCEMSR